ncbi:hypothetical protein GCM10010912_49920 [Paenibacillus albidus]|uniref:Glycoside hydrolase family 32 protein n=1 Tax=Paenibacillus albidus TaxID=2041023 RepID=A0A917FRB4_9BACL|nr:hypothetical protein GCM10010912_49920 [Paenibacillus albidus]
MLNVKKSYTEQFRPQFHLTPPAQWMNDPNGLVLYEGEYHFFYQHHPHSNVWGPMHWGHAVSRDLMHWEHLPVALEPDEHGHIFSGCCVVDWNDSTGLFEGSHGLVALFTHADQHPETGQPRQRQSLAYSRDKGRSWSKYKGNPVLEESGLIDFRDPKVFWHQETDRWIMLLAAGDHIRFYQSENLQEWEYSGEFGSRDGSHDGVWECPDLFELPVEMSGGISKWVLIVSIGDHPSYPEGSRTQYFVGHFDGRSFVNEDSANSIRWLDHGRDNYAGVTWSNSPDEDGRRLFIGWMSNWKYANLTPTESWRGAMTLPRSLSLREQDGDIILIQTPVREATGLRKQTKELRGITLAPHTPFRTEVQDDLLEIEAEFEAGSSSEIIIKLQYSEPNETLIGYNSREQWLYIDRSASGLTSFHEAFACRHGARLRPSQGRVKLHLFLDRSSIELFADDGSVVLTDLIFPEGTVRSIEFSTDSGEAVLTSLCIHSLDSIYALEETSYAGK